MYNSKSFERKPGVNGTMAVGLLSDLGAKNIKQLEVINGASFEAPEQVVTKLQALSLTGSEWQVQEEMEYHLLSGFTPVQTKCYQSNGALVEVACGGSPSPTPGPVPEPNPNPVPIEVNKSWGRARVHTPEALALTGVDTSQVKVCVVDTGIDLNHPNNGKIIGSVGYAGDVQDGAGHGTHTAGTISGTGGIGISRAQLLICKGLSDSGAGSSSALAQCLTWCGQQGAQVVSNSWGGGGADQMINQAATALANRGIYVFFANGNDGGPVSWPARLSGSVPNVFAIAASDKNDQIASFSSRGPETKYISPGVDIISNKPGGGTQSMSGTSMATPHAAAICAFGIAKGHKPCVSTVGSIAGYPFSDAAASAR